MGRGGERSQGKLRFEFRLLLGTGLRDYNDGCPTSRPGEGPTNPHQASPPTQPKDTTFGLPQSTPSITENVLPERIQSPGAPLHL